MVSRSSAQPIRNTVVLLACLTVMVSAQTLWKSGLSAMGGIDIGSDALITQLGRMIKSWRIMGGVALFGLSTVLWLDLLSKMELSHLYPLVSFTYVLAFFAGWIWLGETPNLTRLAGIFVICFGILLVARAE